MVGGELPATSISRFDRVTSGFHSSLVAASLAYAMIAQGAFYPAQALTLACITFAAGVTCHARVPRRVLAAFGVLLLAILGSFAWAHGDPRIALSVLVIAFSATRIGIAASGTGFESPAGLFLGLGAFAAVAGLIGTAFHLEPLALEAQGLWRAASTLTYANSLGAVLVPCLAAGAWRLSRKDRFTDRAGMALVVAGLFTSMSRAAGVALFIGLVVGFIADRGPMLKAIIASRSAVVAGLVVGASALPSIFGPQQPLLILAGVFLGAAICSVGTRSRTGTRVAALALIVAMLGVGVMVVSGAVQGLGARLVNEDRSRIWEASAEAGVDSLPEGLGLGRFEVYEQRHGRMFLIRYAHNEGLQALVETGWLGPIAYLVATALVGWELWVRRRGAALAILVAVSFFTHGMLDFVWHVPAVALLAFLFVGSGLGSKNQARV